MSVKIGIIEDDAALREGLVMAFELEGYETASAGSFRRGKRSLRQEGWTLSYWTATCRAAAGLIW